MFPGTTFQIKVIVLYECTWDIQSLNKSIETIYVKTINTVLWSNSSEEPISNKFVINYYIPLFKIVIKILKS